MQLFYEASYLIIHILHNKINVTNVNYLCGLTMRTEQNPFWALFLCPSEWGQQHSLDSGCISGNVSGRESLAELYYRYKALGLWLFLGGKWTDCVLFWLHQNEAGKKDPCRDPDRCAHSSARFREKNIMIQCGCNVVCSRRLCRGHSRSAAWGWWRLF